MEQKTIGIILGAVILVIVGYMIYTSGPVVSAQGTSEIEVQPDIVSVYINVETRNASLADAQERNNEIGERLLVELAREGIDTDDLQFINYNAYPEYDYSVLLPGGNPREKGYIVSQQLVVKTEEVDEVSSIIDAVIRAKALVQYINFEVSEDKQNEYKIEALEKASKDARAKASAIAEGQGRRLGRLVSIQNQDFYYRGPIALFDKGAVASSGIASDASINAEAARIADSISVNPQDIVVTATINAQYKLLLF